MEEVRHELTWKVSIRSRPRRANQLTLIIHHPGDVTLSAEDMSLNRPAHQVPKEDVVEESGYDPDDYDEEYLDDYLDDWLEREEQEAHHGWLEGSLAVKFLLAGGVAGAGEAFTYLNSLRGNISHVLSQSPGRVPHHLTASRSS